jgi:hypothetical protein
MKSPLVHTTIELISLVWVFFGNNGSTLYSSSGPCKEKGFHRPMIKIPIAYTLDTSST